MTKNNWDCDVTLDQIMDGSFQINDKQVISFASAFEYLGDEFFMLFEFNLDYYTLKLRMYTQKEIEVANLCLTVTHSVFQNL